MKPRFFSSLRHAFFSLSVVATVAGCLGAAPSFADSAKLTFNGRSYQRFDTGMSWTAAKTFCEAKGAHLATITSQMEQDFVAANFLSVFVWLGATDLAQTGTWRWITGEPWGYTNWQAGEPNNQGGVEHYLSTATANLLQWNDAADASSTIVPLCEWDALVATQSAGDQFSPSSNPNGTWTYGYKLTADSPLQLFDNGSSTARGISGMYGWNASIIGSEPHIYFNSTSSPISFANTVTVPPRTIQMHPGANGVIVVLRWTAPVAGTYTFSGTFLGNDAVAAARTASIRVGGTDVFGGAVGGLGSTMPFTIVRSLAPGDVVDFSVDPAGVHQNDSTGLNLTVSNAGTAPPTQGLVTHYALSGNANDTGSQGNNGVVAGSVSFPTAIGANFNPSPADSSGWVQALPALNRNTSFTVSAWVKPSYLDPSGANPSTIVYERDASGGDVCGVNSAANYGVQFYNGQYSFDVSTISNGICTLSRIFGTTVPALNTWSHVLGIYDLASGQQRLYINGVLETVATVGPELRTTPAARFNISRNSPSANQPFHGDISDVRVYDRVLSANELTALVGAFPSVNGTCGTADKLAVATAPTTNLCSTGTPSPVTGAGPWNWTCIGIGGGTNASCATSVATVSSITQDINLLGVPITFTVTGNNLPPYMRFAVRGCTDDAVEVNKDRATTSHRDFRCIATEPASFPDAFTINLRGSTVNIAPTQSFAPLPLPTSCTTDSDVFASLLAQYGNRGAGAARYGEIAFRPLNWSDLVTITTTLNSSGVCHESLPEDIRLELMSGLASWNAKKDAALADLSTTVGRERAKFTAKIMADAASIGLDFIGVGETISTVKRLKKVSPGRVWRSIKKWGSAAGITARLGAKIAAYSTLSDLAALGSDGLSLAFDGLYVSDSGLTAEQRADVVNDLIALAADGIAFSDPLEKFLKGVTPFSTDLKKELLRFSIVASTRLATDAAVQGIDANTYVAAGMELGSSAMSFLPIVGGVFDAWKDIGDAQAAVNTAFATVEQALDDYSRGTNLLLTSSLRNKLSRKFQAAEDRLAPLRPSKDVLDFGALRSGQQESLQIRLQNVSSASVTMIDYEIDDEVFSFGDSTCTGTIAPSGSCALAVNFNATGVGAYTGLLRINYRKAGLPYQTRITVGGAAISSLTAGTGAASVTLAAPNQAGSIALAITNASGTSSNCQIDRARVTDASSSLFGGSVYAPVAPPRVSFPLGFVDFKLTGCNLGETLNVRIDYPYDLPPKSAFSLWKRWENGSLNQILQFGAVGLPANFTVSGRTLTYSVTDGGSGDMDGLLNGKIVDPVGIGLTCDLDFNGDGQITADQDGVILSRYLLGFRGAALVANIPLGGNRANAQAVEDFVGSAMKYDVFGRPTLAANALQDGLILSRLMLGQPDAALLNGLTIAGTAQYQDAASIRNNVNTRCGTAY